jgi:DNA-binding NarL/FixJ family response regulator
MRGIENKMRKLATSTAVSMAHVHLTPTQMKVLRGVHSGLMNKQIAFDLGIAEATVKVHMTAVMRKLKVSNRTQAAVLVKHINERSLYEP